MQHLQSSFRPGAGSGDGGNIQCHAWSPDRSVLAVSHGQQDVQLYTRTQEDWQQTGVLSQHDLTVTSIDWAPLSNRIVTCSQDRNAYVWVPDGHGHWR